MTSGRFVLSLLALTVLGTGLAAADPRDEVLAGAARCSAIRDYRAWLDCYYGAAQPLRALLGLAPASAEQQRLSASVSGGAAVAPAPGPAPNSTAMARTAPAEFGLPERHPEGEHVSARMTGFTMDRSGIFTATLSNGQVWRQESGDTHVYWDKPADKAVYNVVIERGVLGSYNLRVEGRPGAYKVARVQ